MRYDCAVPLIGAVGNLVIGALVLRQGVRDRVHRAFALMALNAACWNLGIFSLYYFKDPVEAEWWNRLFRTGIIFAAPSTFHLTVLFLGPVWRRIDRQLLVAGYAFAGLVAVMNLRGMLVAHLVPHQWGWYIVPTRWYALVTGLVVVFLPLSAWRTWSTYRSAPSPRHRVQAKFWLLAAAVQIPLAGTNFLQVYGVNIYPLGNLGNVAFLGIIAYAIVRHRLMDVDYVVRMGVSFGLACTLVLLPGGLVLEELAKMLGASESPILACAAVTLALVGVILIPSLQRALETRVQRAFFPHLYDYRQRLRRLAAGLVHVVDQTELLRRLGTDLADILDVALVEVYVRDERNRALVRSSPRRSGPSRCRTRSSRISSRRSSRFSPAR